MNTLEERLKKEKFEFEQAQKVLEAYKLLQGDDTKTPRELEEEQREQQQEEQKEEQREEEEEEEDDGHGIGFCCIWGVC